MDPNYVIKFFVIATLLEALRKESISQVQVENTSDIDSFQQIFIPSATTRSSRLGGGRRDDRSVFSPPPDLTVSVLLSVLALRLKKI